MSTSHPPLFTSLTPWQEYKKIGEQYRKGEMLTGEVCYVCSYVFWDLSGLT